MDGYMEGERERKATHSNNHCHKGLMKDRASPLQLLIPEQPAICFHFQRVRQCWRRNPSDQMETEVNLARAVSLVGARAVSKFSGAKRRPGIDESKNSGHGPVHFHTFTICMYTRRSIQ